MKPHHTPTLCAFAVSCALVLAGGLALPRFASADVVMPPPDDCPGGTTPRTGHNGPYCQPPAPTDCPPGHVGKVHMTHAYCDPPPAEPCPTGSRWTSTSATDGYCRGGWPCEIHQCAEGNTCKESSLCVQEIRMFRAGSYEKASGTCAADADCPEGESCVTKKRCDPDVKRALVEGAEGTPDTAPEAAEGGGDATEEPTAEAAPEAVTEAEAEETDDVPAKGCSLGRGTPEIGALAAVLLLLGVRLVLNRKITKS